MPSSSILVTKLFIPPTRPELVSRPGLVERLNQSCDAGSRLSLVSAPAGFGKTTLVGAWVNALGQGGGRENQTKRVAWLSLDEHDNDLVRFLAYMIAALRTIEAEMAEGVLSALQSPQPPPAEAVLTALINDLAGLSRQVVLVLDDYHLIETQPIHDALSFLIENMPPQMYLVLATRVDPPLPLSRWRARGQLAELRANDLRFSPAEAADFLNRMMGLDLSEGDIAALETRTEGWIAGLQLAAISMRGHADAADLIQSFTGSHRLVLDYLIEEVLNRQTQEVQTFLLQTSILDRLTGDLCDALTGQEDGQEMLEMLEHANLFIVPLDEERRWYRYHHLFADLLRQRLHQAALEVHALHIQASQWCEQNGFGDEAIGHALRANDFERSANLLEERADLFWRSGEDAKLRRWLEAIPPDLLIKKPNLGILHAYYLHSHGQNQAGEHLLNEIEERINDGGDHRTESSQLSEPDRQRLLGKLAAIRSIIDSNTGDIQAIIQHASRALLVHLPENDLTWRSIAAFALGDAQSFLGDMAASYQARLEALHAAEAAGNDYYVLVANLKLGSTLWEQGELARAAAICQQQAQAVKKNGLWQSGTFGCLLTLWGQVLAELNDLENAFRKASEGVKLAESAGNLAVTGYSYNYMMRVLFSRGDLDHAEEIIRKVARLDQEAAVPHWIREYIANWQTRIWLLQDRMEPVNQWVKYHRLDLENSTNDLPEMDFNLLFEYILFARVLIAQNRLDEADALLLHLLKAAESGGRTTRVIEILLLQALSFQAQGETECTIAAYERALTLAEPCGFIRIFVDEGPPMASLLYEALARGIAPEYVRRLLAAFPAEKPKPAAVIQQQARQEGLIEPLSEREIEVLQLIAEGLTNPEIAARLFLSLHTIKTHTRNIYGKLGVSNRTQAVARGKSVGVLSGE